MIAHVLVRSSGHRLILQRRKASLSHCHVDERTVLLIRANPCVGFVGIPSSQHIPREVGHNVHEVGITNQVHQLVRIAFELSWPIIIAKRAGAHSGLFEYAELNVTPARPAG